MTPTQIAEARAMERVYLIWKQGGYYRPNSKGYTTSAIQAGRYTLAEAIDITHPNGPDGPRDGMGYVHEDDVIDADWQAYTALIEALQAQTARADAAELREAGLLATNETERQTLIRHNAAHAAQVADLKAKMELVGYALQDNLHNRMTPRVVDIAYSAFMLGRSGKNNDDGGPCDWFNDTKPMVMAQIAKIDAAIKSGGA